MLLQTAIARIHWPMYRSCFVAAVSEMTCSPNTINAHEGAVDGENIDCDMFRPVGLAWMLLVEAVFSRMHDNEREFKCLPVSRKSRNSDTLYQLKPNITRFSDYRNPYKSVPANK
ncbi:hypothetical protein ANN_13881 [Periplaneta americana]|uniref:Uncharacterized protein n=1 Tax=Periplaneta americana TaxID=6978 RepID=A0ABQ8SW93_PERAM|nr:hypothetical protein ANN_13881 [Periplaneta americana]